MYGSGGGDASSAMQLTSRVHVICAPGACGSIATRRCADASGAAASVSTLADEIVSAIGATTSPSASGVELHALKPKSENTVTRRRATS